MILSKDFYCLRKERTTREKHYPAPLFRKSFNLKKDEKKLEVTICGLGIYELFFNGKRVTKGYLSPYRSNPNHYIYYDNYDLTEFIKDGENVIGLMLGNGLNSSVMNTWNFKNLSWACGHRFAIAIELDGKLIFDGESFKCKDSEITFDDFHCGEHVDARLRIKGWCDTGFNDSKWQNVIKADVPNGEAVLCTADPIKVYNVRKPVRKINGKDGFIYDIGVSTAGTYNLKIKGEEGQEIKVTCGDAVKENGELFIDNVTCGITPDTIKDYVQCDWYILSGRKDEFEPRFTYKGCRFIEIKGISKEQSETLELCFYELSSSFKLNGDFYCDNADINRFQDMTVRSDRSNFFYFPTDCPQREKNGWTGDSVLSAEQFLLNLDCANSLKEWLKNICKSQKEDGMLPGIIPTDDWGYEWGNGPAWDAVIFEIPYRIYVYTGDAEAIKTCSSAMLKYLKYMETKRLPNGCFAYGLGDWCCLTDYNHKIFSGTPFENTDTIYCKYICDLAEKCFTIIGDNKNAKYAADFSEKIKSAYAKAHLWNNSNSLCNTVCDQAMAIYYGMIDENMYETAYSRLLDYLKMDDYKTRFGVLANRVVFRVLAEHGDVDIALKILLNDFPSMKHSIGLGATTLWEIIPIITSRIDKVPSVHFEKMYESLNHHFWGDISAFFYRHLAGIQIETVNSVKISPCFTNKISRLTAYHDLPSGRVSVSYKVCDITAYYDVDIPKGIIATVIPPKGYDYNGEKTLTEGKYQLVFVKNIL